MTVTALPEIVEVPENQTQEYELSVTANPGPSAAIKVTVGTDEALVAKYNLTNGTEYVMLPSAAYEISATPLTIMRYNKKSDPGTLKLKGAGCEIGTTYLLPLVVAQVTGSTAFEAPEDKVVYVVYKMLEAQLEGAGTAASPYLIGDVESFCKIGNVLKEGETVYVKLSADIDFAGQTWTPEVSEGVYAQVNASGRPISFDGDNHTVKNVVAPCSFFTNLEGSVQNLKLDNIKVEAAVEKAGLFVQTAGNGTDEVVIKNITVIGSTLVSAGYAGGFAGSVNKGKVENVNVACTITGVSRVGGVFGHAISTDIKDCVVSGTVTGTGNYAGGVVGLMYAGSVTNTSSSADVTCEATLNSYARVGGIVGQSNVGATFEKCSSTGAIVGKGYYGGGLVGVIDASEEVEGVLTDYTTVIEKCFTTGSVTLNREGNKKDAGAGGLVGMINGGIVNITDCYSTASIESDRYSSGFVGDISYGKKTVLAITRGFASGDLSKLGPDANGNHSDGVVVGMVRDDKGTLADATITCSGFVAWDGLGRNFAFQAVGTALSSAGNYHGTEGTISQQAKALGWDESVWDLSGDVPALK